MIAAALITVIIEVGFFLLIGYRDRLLLVYWTLVNLFTNIALNLSLRLLMLAGVGRGTLELIALPAELIVVFSEWLLLSVPLGRTKKLLLLVFVSNLLSYLAGLLYGLFF